MNKIGKTLSYIVAASFLAFVPIKGHAQSAEFKVKIELPEEQKELLDYSINLAVDIDEDGKPDKKGYETLFEKIRIDYDKNQSLEKFQEQIQDYITSSSPEDIGYLFSKASSMFTEKDSELYWEKAFELTTKVIEELIKELPQLEKQLNDLEK